MIGLELDRKRVCGATRVGVWRRRLADGGGGVLIGLFGMLLGMRWQVAG